MTEKPTTIVPIDLFFSPFANIRNTTPPIARKGVKEDGLRSCSQKEPPSGYRGNISRTCHNIGELKAAKKQSNYVFLKTLFDSQSNPADKSTLNMEELRDASRHGLIDKKVYAMGGMNLDNISVAKDLGFGGVVICGDLWNRFNITAGLDYKELISHFLKLRKAVG